MEVVLIGVAIGIASAFGLTNVIATFLFGVTPRDPLVFVIVPSLLTAVAFCRIWIRHAGARGPGRRASDGITWR